MYGGRLGNGPEASGDGWRYRGRGPIQLTGKSNYRTCGAALGVDLVAEPALLETAEVGCLAAAWFWADKGLNALADAGDFVTITRRINGGLIGLADRRELWERAKAVFGVAPAMPEGVEAETVRGAARRLGPLAGRRLGPGGGARPAPRRERQPTRPAARPGPQRGVAPRPAERSLAGREAPEGVSAGSHSRKPTSRKPARRKPASHKPANRKPAGRTLPRPRPGSRKRGRRKLVARKLASQKRVARKPTSRRSSRRPAHRKVRAISTGRKRHRPARPARRRGARLRVS